MEIGIIKTVTLVEGRLECEVDLGANWVETATLYGLSSINEYPLPGDEVAVDIDGAEIAILALFRANPEGIESGDSILYSRDANGDMMASVKLSADGTATVNGGERSAVGYQDLKDGFDMLKDDFNNLVTVFSNHTHPYVDTPIGAAVTSITGTAGVSSSASIDSSESETLKIP